MSDFLQERHYQNGLLLAEMGAIFRARREYLGLDMEAMASRVGISSVLIHYLETGKRPLDWAHIARCAPHYLLDVVIVPSRRESDLSVATTIARIFKWGSQEDFLVGIEAVMRGIRYAREHPELPDDDT